MKVKRDGISASTGDILVFDEKNGTGHVLITTTLVVGKYGLLLLENSAIIGYLDSRTDIKVGTDITIEGLRLRVKDIIPNEKISLHISS